MPFPAPGSPAGAREQAGMCLPPYPGATDQMKPVSTFSGRRSNSNEGLLPILALERLPARGGFETLHESPKLKSEKSILGAGSAENGKKSLGADENGLGLAVDRQNAAGIGVFQVLENFRQIAV